MKFHGYCTSIDVLYGNYNLPPISICIFSVAEWNMYQKPNLKGFPFGQSYQRTVSNLDSLSLSSPCPCGFCPSHTHRGNAGIAKIDRILKEFFSRFDPRGRNPLTKRKLSVNEIAIIIFNLLAKDSGTTKTYAAPFKNEKRNIRDVPIFFFVHHTLQG